MDRSNPLYRQLDRGRGTEYQEYVEDRSYLEEEDETSKKKSNRFEGIITAVILLLGIIGMS